MADDVSRLLTEPTPESQLHVVNHPPFEYYQNDEIALRNAVEEWGRARWPAARCCHELVMDRGSTRADMVFVSPDHLVAIELKSHTDGFTRVFHQVALFQLATPETWLIADQRHGEALDMIAYLLPSIGIARGVLAKDRDIGRKGAHRKIEVIREPSPFTPWPRATLNLLWVAELHAEAVRAGVWADRAGTHQKMVAALAARPPAEQMAAVCRQLRARHALWRADPPIVDAPHPSPIPAERRAIAQEVPNG